MVRRCLEVNDQREADPRVQEISHRSRRAGSDSETAKYSSPHVREGPRITRLGYPVSPLWRIASMPLVVFLVPGRNGVIAGAIWCFKSRSLKGGSGSHAGWPTPELLRGRLKISTSIRPRWSFTWGVISAEMSGRGGVTEEDVRVDACGSYPGMDDLTRDDIIDEARAYYEIDPSIFQRQNIRSCYWMGDPLPSGHPLFPRAA